MKCILVTTEHRGVFIGHATEDDIVASETTRRVRLTGAKMAIRFGTSRGVAELAATGPTKTTKVGAAADVLLHNVTAIFSVTPEAEAAWAAA